MPKCLNNNENSKKYFFFYDFFHDEAVSFAVRNFWSCDLNNRKPVISPGSEFAPY